MHAAAWQPATEEPGSIKGEIQESGPHGGDEETHHHPQHSGSHRPALARISQWLTKNGVLAIAHQNADRASSTHRNNWLSLVWLPACRQTGVPTVLRWNGATFRFASQRQNTQSTVPIQPLHRTLKPMPQKIQHPCRHTGQNSNSKIFFRICH